MKGVLNINSKKINLSKKIKENFMKKTILSFVFILALTVISNAAPRFGIVAEQGSGLGAFISDDMYNAQLTLTTSNNDDGTTKKSTSRFKIGGNYKIALDSVTALTAGVNYQMINGDETENSGGSSEHDGSNILAVSVGFERALSSNIVLTTQTDLYSQQTIKIKGSSTENKTTSLFSNARVGVAYLF